MDARLATPLCSLLGIEFPIVQTGMGWVAGARLASATSTAGGLGIIASATMDLAQLSATVAAVKARTSKPFGVNLRADAADISDRVDLLIAEGVRVASFAQAPKQTVIDRLHDGGVLVVPSIGAKRHAEKVLDWGVDAVLVQGGEGGGHTGSVPTSLLLPQVVDVVAGRVPVIAAGGFFDGRGLVAALAYGAAGIAMGTRFLLTSDSAVPAAVKNFYLGKSVTDTTVTRQVDGVPHRVLNTDLVTQLESGRGRALALPRAARNALRFKRLTGTSLRAMMREGRAMRESMDLSVTQMVMAANTPMLLRAALVDGNVESGVMASGQVVGLIDDLPTCAELIERVIAEAEATLQDLARMTAVTLHGAAGVRAAAGTSLGMSEWVDVSAEQFAQFAAATGDAEATYLAVSLSNMLLPEIVTVRGFAMGVNYGTDTVRIIAAVQAGDRVRARATLVDVTDVNRGIQTQMTITVESAMAGDVCVIEALSRWLDPLAEADADSQLSPPGP